MTLLNFYSKKTVLLLNSIFSFINELNAFNLIFLITLFVFLAHPAMTEHVEFALSSSDFFYISKFNNFFLDRLEDKSSQIILAKILLDLKISPNYAQIILSFILTLIPISALLFLIRFLAGPRKIDNIFFSLVCLFFFISNPINTSLYPWSPRIDFFEFGNQGLWLFVLALSLIFLNKIAGYFLAGLLFSWHLVWFIPILLVLYLENKKSIYRFIFAFIFGFLISVIIFISYANLNLNPSISVGTFDSLANMFSFQKISNSAWTAHNPVIFGKNFNIRYLFTALLPIIVLYKYKKEFFLDQRLLRFSFALYFVIFAILLYLELASTLALPFSNLLQRAIVNRYFNFFTLVLLINSFLFFYFKKDWGFRKNNFQYLLIPFSCLFYLKLFHIFLAFLILYLIKMSSTFLKKCLKIFFVLLFLLTIFVKDSKNYFNAFGFLKHDSIVHFLSGKGNGAGYIVSREIQSFRGLNITTLSNSQYFVPRAPLIYRDQEIDLFCYNSVINKKDLSDWNVDNCFMRRSRSEWSTIFDLLNVKYVIVHANILLDLDLMADSQGLKIYGISNN